MGFIKYIDTHYIHPRGEMNFVKRNDLIKQEVEKVINDKDNKIQIFDRDIFINNVTECVEIYEDLIGLENNGNGEIPNLTKKIIGYFKEHAEKYDSKENKLLKTAGCIEIKIRYKFIDSVIKKVVKLCSQNLDLFDNKNKLFIDPTLGLHDLIGIKFICTYPYQKVWIARTLYNYFDIPNRGDEHLEYGFYNIDRESGYKALHCDIANFNPKYQIQIQSKWNVEIQILTSFEESWSKMEHSVSYNLLEKSGKKDASINAQWRLLSDSLKNIEIQFENLKNDTEQSTTIEYQKRGYGFLFNNEENLKSLISQVSEKLEKLEVKLVKHEVSRIEYINETKEQIKFLKNKKYDENDTLKIKLQIAFIYYSYTNYHEFFNLKDIRNLVNSGILIYMNIMDYIVSTNLSDEHRLIVLNVGLRYGRLTQKFGYGLIDRDFFDENTNVSQLTDHLLAKKYLLYALVSLIKLHDSKLDIIKSDSNYTYFKIIHKLDFLCRELELGEKVEYLESYMFDGEIYVFYKTIKDFRKKFITKELKENFLEANNNLKIKNAGFIINFYSTLIYYKLIKPIDCLSKLIDLSSYSNVLASDYFYYEISAYHIMFEEYKNKKNILEDEKEIYLHMKRYHIDNMIYLIYKIKKDENYFEYLKAKAFFKDTTGETFILEILTQNLQGYENERSSKTY